jgi:flagellar motility protein MotE (MotC chaperone)
MFARVKLGPVGLAAVAALAAVVALVPSAAVGADADPVLELQRRVDATAEREVVHQRLVAEAAAAKQARAQEWRQLTEQQGTLEKKLKELQDKLRTDYAAMGNGIPGSEYAEKARERYFNRRYEVAATEEAISRAKAAVEAKYREWEAANREMEGRRTNLNRASIELDRLRAELRDARGETEEILYMLVAIPNGPVTLRASVNSPADTQNVDKYANWLISLKSRDQKRAVGEVSISTPVRNGQLETGVRLVQYEVKEKIPFGPYPPDEAHRKKAVLERHHFKVELHRVRQ